MDVDQGEEHGENQEWRAVQEQVVAFDHAVKYSRTFEQDEMQQGVRIVDRIQVLEHDAAGRAQSQSQCQAIFDQRTDDVLKLHFEVHDADASPMRVLLNSMPPRPSSQQVRLRF